MAAENSALPYTLYYIVITILLFLVNSAVVSIREMGYHFIAVAFVVYLN